MRRRKQVVTAACRFALKPRFRWRGISLEEGEEAAATGEEASWLVVVRQRLQTLKNALSFNCSSETINQSVHQSTAVAVVAG